MQLIAILLVTVSILALLSGFAVFLGSSKGSRAHALSFLITTVGVFGWALSMAIFLTLGEDAADFATIPIFGIYLFTLVMDLFVLIYTGWKIKWSVVPIVISIIASLFLGGALIYNPHFLYDSITLGTSINSIAIKLDWYYISYIALMLFEGASVVLLILHRIKHTTNSAFKRGWTGFLVCLAIGWIIAGIFDLYLPLYRYDLIWIGPLFIALDFVIHYYAIIKYHLLDLASSWLKILSHIIVMSLAAVVYLTLFFVIFMALFKVPSPSTPVIILNVVMIAVVLLLFPVLNELSSYFRSLSSIKDIDMVYFVKKIGQLSRSYLNYHELAGFLSDHLHFQYVGLVIDKKLYGSKQSRISAAEVAHISNYRTPIKGIWLALDDATRDELKKCGIEAVAILRNAEGVVVGKIMLGRPSGNISFRNRDLPSLETALTLTAAAISSDKGPKN
ncbi:hypothetical protein IKF94_02985 [Candidatus Saccharibacteria bacterium]|nr:hypothetical protein [Candidatus Saccharibacteria bacterium]